MRSSENSQAPNYESEIEKNPNREYTVWYMVYGIITGVSKSEG